MDYTVSEHESSPRMKRIQFNHDTSNVGAISESTEFGKMCDEIRSQLYDSTAIGCTVELCGQPPTKEVFEGWCSAISNTVGSILEEDLNTNALAMPKKDLVNINLIPENRKPALLHFGNPELPWPLHTDRALYDESGDFVLVGKFQEEGLIGGRIRLLHIDDWRECSRFILNPLAFELLEWKGDENLAGVAHYAEARRASSVQAPVFSWNDQVLTIRFTDGRFRRPRSAEQLKFLREVSESLAEAANSVNTFELPRYGIYIVNNKRVLHGRDGFSVDSEKYCRILVRICGVLH
jgi:hypothetical protein